MRKSTDQFSTPGLPARLGAALLALALAFSAPVPVLAQDGAADAAKREKPAGDKPASNPDMVRIELNRLEPQGESCRAYFLIENPGPVSYSSLKLDLFAFDKGGVIAKRLAVDLAPLRTQKTSVKLFDFSGLVCAQFGRLLLNDVIACMDEDGARDGCTDRIETASRAAVPFVK